LTSLTVNARDPQQLHARSHKSPLRADIFLISHLCLIATNGLTDWPQTTCLHPHAVTCSAPVASYNSWTQNLPQAFNGFHVN